MISPSRKGKKKRHDREAVAFFHNRRRALLLCAVKRLSRISGLDDFQLVFY